MYVCIYNGERAQTDLELVSPQSNYGSDPVIY